MQIDNTLIDQITQNIFGVIEKFGETRQEMIRKIRDAVQEGVEHFDLVGREEFDAAQQLLANTRIKMEALEKRVTELEAALGDKKDASD